MERMKRTRGVIRSDVTRTLNVLTDLLRGTDPDFTDLLVHLDFLLQKEAQLKELENEIKELVDDEDLENEVVGTLEYNMNISHTVTRIRCALARNHIASNPSQVSDNGTALGDRDQVSARTGGLAHVPARQTPRTVALPKLQIPSFSGNLRDWQGFWDHFRATIHDNVDLPHIEKFKYLQTYLTGPAKQAVEWVRLSDEGYDLAIKALLERFGRSSILIDEHIDQLLALSPVNSSNDIARLRHLYDSIQFRTSCLEGLGVPPTQYAIVLRRVLMRSLPNDLAVLFRQNIKEKESPTEAGDMQTATGVPGAAEVATILRFLRIQIESREESQGGLQRSSSHSPPEDRRGTRPSSAQHSLPSALALPTSSVAPEPGSCPLCTGPVIAVRRHDWYAVPAADAISPSSATYGASLKTSQDRASPASVNHVQTRTEAFQTTLQADTEVGVLIGSDVYWKVATGHIRRLSEHLTAVHTIFGWMVQGRYMRPTSDRSNTTAVSTTSFETSHSEMLPNPSEMWRPDAIGISDLPLSDPATHSALLQFNEQFVKKRNGDSARVYAGVVFSEASTLSDAYSLHQRDVSVPSDSPKKELLVKLYRQHVLNDDRFTSGDYSSDEDVRDTSKEHDDSCTLPGVSDSFTHDSEHVQEAASAAHEQRQRPDHSIRPNRHEFSATEEEEPQVIPEDNSDDEDGGTPLQKGPTTFSPLSVRSVRFNLSNSNSPGVNEAVQPSRRSFTYSTRSSSTLPQAGSPVHMTLRSRVGTRGEDMAGHSAATTPAVGKQRRMYMAVNVLIVLVVITVNVLIYLRTPVEQGSFKTNILINRSRIAPIKPVTLPRLELLACLLRARLFDYVKKTLRIAHLQVQFWTDSEVVLRWIAGDATRWQQFVRNRVIEIQRPTEGFPWTHCPSHDNPVECIRVLRDNDVISVVWRERDTENISSAPNCVVRNDGAKRHLEEPDLLPQKKRKPKVAASIDPPVNLFPAVVVSLKVSVASKINHKRSDHESHWDDMEADGAQRKEADDRGLGEADDGLQGGAKNEGQSDANEDEAFAPDDCSTPVLQKMLMDKSEQPPPSLEKSLKVCKLQLPGLESAVKAGRGGADFRVAPLPPRITPRAVTEQGTPLLLTTAEPETKSEPHPTARSYAFFPNLNTPSKVLELDAKYCRNMLGYKEGKVRHHSNTDSTTGRGRGHRRRRQHASSAMETWSGNEDVLRQTWRDLSMLTTILQRLGTTPNCGSRFSRAVTLSAVCRRHNHKERYAWLSRFCGRKNVKDEVTGAKKLLEGSCRLRPGIDDLNQNPPLRTVPREQRK
ncbi:hypothetical protein HPB47_020023 [Ixodes persulcatus]|uniref:Uncharacterized protein n=1 Tax=Ixodes persulcatus TaxID=34615 RepID=A0AC60QIR9_IXOPE|nr:hypothetical protein HPB47_020023 [Ixodes persulcatus]